MDVLTCVMPVKSSGHIGREPDVMTTRVAIASKHVTNRLSMPRDAARIIPSGVACQCTTSRRQIAGNEISPPSRRCRYDGTAFACLKFARLPGQPERLAQPKLVEGERRLAERVGFVPSATRVARWPEDGPLRQAERSEDWRRGWESLERPRQVCVNSSRFR